MKMELIILFLLVILQNASFTLVSRARNSGSFSYHAVAATLSNGFYIFVFDHLNSNVEELSTKIVYIIGTVIGSVLMHYISIRYIEKGKRKVGA